VTPERDARAPDDAPAAEPVLFGRATRTWFEQSFAAPTEVQRRGWEAIAAGEHALLVAPTGSGKTLAAFLWAIDGLARERDGAPPGYRVVYVSPLKALVYDVERNLRAPLAGVARTAERLGATVRTPVVDVRTGDTPQRERQRMARSPGDVLVTTPESLYLLLGSRARENLRSVETVIVDEIHALAPTKRGAHLALTLERLAALAERDPQRIGLSATVRPLDEVARFLGGDRPVRTVDASEPPRLELEIRVPVADMENVPPPAEPERGGSILGELYAYQNEAPARERGIWSAIYPELVREIREHRSTLLFVNSRGLCERLAQRLNGIAGEELVLAHHGSVSHAKRAEIEDGLKQGRIRAIVATSSLELGIDMGAVDLVVLVESPGSVARGLQRVGRAGHGVGETSVGRLYPKFRGDLLECALVAERMRQGAIEALRVPRNALDVLAQQLVAACCERARTVDELARLVRRAAPYAELSRELLCAVLDMLSGRYPSRDFADLRPRLRWDRATDTLSARRGTELVSRMNAGTIPDRGTYGVHLGPDGPRVGELDEEMVFESRDGDTFLLGASTWRVEEITRDRVVVSPAPGEPGRLPFWKGDGPGRPLELGRALGAFTRELGAELAGGDEHAARWLRERLPLSPHAAGNLVAYAREQLDATGTLPTDRAITVERFRDELGDWRVCILTPFGSRVHAPWAMMLEERLADRDGVDVQLMYSDDGIVLRFADTGELPDTDLLFREPDEVTDLVTRRLGSTALFSSLFRENAVRSLLVTRRRPDQRSPLWLQRIKTRALLATVQGFPDFPIVLETYRQALRDVFDLDGLEEVLRGVESRAIAVEAVETRSPSPFARSLVFAYVAAYLYDGDSPVAERKAQALTLDRGLLRELLGQAELRELIDPTALAELEAELAGTAAERRARDRDELHDLLKRVGDATAAELEPACEQDPAPWLAELAREHRAVELFVAGELRWAAAEDAGLLRDALGANPPSGLPAAFLEPVADALEQLVRRFAGARGPFLTRDLARRYGLAPGQVEPVLRALERAGALVLGELRPGGTEPEWCDAEVLRRLKRRTLARLRNEVAAVDPTAFARFLPRWHGLLEPRAGEDALLAAIDRLEGLALPWSSLATELLPARVAGFTLDALDLLAATGRVVWVGRSPLGLRDGRVALYRRERVAELLEPAADFEPPSALHAALLDRLGERGACFLTELVAAVRGTAGAAGGAREVEAALWDLVWAGQVTNDTFQPLRALGRTRRASRGRQAWKGVLAGGRWSLVRDLVPEPAEPTARALARACALLERYGIVSREAAQAEEQPFGPLYKVLREMEDAGRARRGWFVEGLAGAQFAWPGAVDRLRAERRGAAAEPEVVALPAIDPANAYGALLPWPAATDEGVPRPRRVAGAWVGLCEGRLAWYASPRRRQVLVFGAGLEPAALGAALEALRDLPQRGRRLVAIDEIDGRPALESPHLEAFLAAGFVRDYRGLIADPDRPFARGRA